MPLGGVNRSRIAAIQRSLAVYVDEDDPVQSASTARPRSGVGLVMEPLRELLNFDVSVAYSVEEDGDTNQLTLSEVSGRCDLARLRSLLGDTVRRTSRFAGYDPRRPEPWNRNRVMLFDDLVRRRVVTAPVTQDAMPRLGLAPRDQMRVLVCDGPSLLAWVGGYRKEPYTQRDRRVLGALAPGLRRRLALERRLRSAGPTRAALEVAMEAIAAPAFLVAAHGAPVLANSAGRAALDRERIALRARLRGAVRSPDAAGLEVTPVVSRGSPPHFLVIARTGARARAKVEIAARRWDLSRRHVDVLAWVVEGASNARIGAELGIADRTVEAHLTAIFTRAGVASRSELIVATMRL